MVKQVKGKKGRKRWREIDDDGAALEFDPPSRTLTAAPSNAAVCRDTRCPESATLVGTQSLANKGVCSAEQYFAMLHAAHELRPLYFELVVRASASGFRS